MTYLPGVTIITPTGGRPQAFSLCQKYVERQTWKSPLQWIVVSDVEKIAVSSSVETMVIYPPKMWIAGSNTLSRNILAALPHVIYERVIFAEDDDFYSPSHVATLSEWLFKYELVGNPTSRYYHIPSGRYRIMANCGVASLGQTGMRASLIPLLEEICETTDFIDFRLWSEFRNRGNGTAILTSDKTCVGIKGLPGRRGIGVGHRPNDNPDQWTADSDKEVLRSWIGDDIELYREFMR